MAKQQCVSMRPISSASGALLATPSGTSVSLTRDSCGRCSCGNAASDIEVMVDDRHARVCHSTRVCVNARSIPGSVRTLPVPGTPFARV